MNTFEELLKEENSGEEKDLIVTLGNVSIYHTDHSLNDRMSRVEDKTFIPYICTKAIEVLPKVRSEFKNYMVFSKKYFQSILVIIETRNHLLLRTIYEKGHDKPQKGTPRIVVEKFEIDVNKYSQKFISYVNFLLDGKIKKSDLQYNFNPVEIEDGLRIVLDTNKLDFIDYNYMPVKIIEVD